jgi:hypothetical protein
MEIRPISQTFVAGVPTVVPVGGRYFRVTGNVNPFVLEVGRDGQYVATIPDAIAGDRGECRAGEPDFDSLRITTTGTELVKILVTDGTITRDSQNSDVSDRAGRLLGIASIARETYIQAKFTSGVASAVMLAANAVRKAFTVQNPDNSKTAWIRLAAAPAVADATCFKLGPGQTWEPPVVPLGEIRVISDVAAHDLQVIEA